MQRKEIKEYKNNAGKNYYHISKKSYE